MRGGSIGGGMVGGMRGGSIGAGPFAGPMHSGMIGTPFRGHTFTGAPVTRAALGPQFSNFGFRGPHGFHHRFFHHRFHRFGFFGAPFFYAGYYDGCWRRAWTPYGWRWVNVCYDYGYGFGY